MSSFSRPSISTPSTFLIFRAWFSISFATGKSVCKIRELLPHVAAATAAEIAAAAIAPYVQKRLASLTRSRDACEAELKVVSQSR